MYQADLEGELIRFFGEEIGFRIFFTVLKKKKKKGALQPLVESLCPTLLLGF
jgi:hypothetical protein